MIHFAIIGVGSLVTGLVYLAGAYWLADAWSPGVLELAAVWTSFVCTLYCVVQSRWNYIPGIISVALYSWLLFKEGLPGVALFNLYLVGSLVYGWFRWGPDRTTRPVTRLKTYDDYLNYLGLTFVIAVALGLFSVVFDFELTHLDFAVAVLSGLAQFLLDNKRIETWVVWFVVNVLSLVLYSTAGLYLVTLQYLFFLFNTFLGFYLWYRKLT